MRNETTMAAKLKAAGIDTASARLYTEAGRVLHESKGKPEKALNVFINTVLSESALLDALALRFLREVAENMKGLPGEGHPVRASDGQSSFADARQPDGGGEAPVHEPQGQTRIASPPPTNPERAGHKTDAEKSREVIARPVREPSPADRKAAAAVRQSSAAVVLEHLGWLGKANIPGGPKYIDLRVRDLAGMLDRQLAEGATHARSAVVLKMIAKAIERLGTVDQDQRWVDVLSAKEVKHIAALTEAETLAPMALGWLRGLNNHAQLAIEGAADHG